MPSFVKTFGIAFPFHRPTLRKVQPTIKSVTVLRRFTSFKAFFFVYSFGNKLFKSKAIGISLHLLAKSLMEVIITSKKTETCLLISELKTLNRITFSCASLPEIPDLQTFTIAFPRFSPLNNPMKAIGMFSNPSVMCSWNFSFPCQKEERKLMSFCAPAA